MPLVQETVYDPSGHEARDVQIEIVLIASVEADGNTAGYTTDPSVILGRWRHWTDKDGHWSATLVANSLIHPANSYYTLRRKGNGVHSDDVIVVPNGAGPYWVPNLLSVAPTALPTFLSDVVGTALAAEAAAGIGSKLSREDHVHPFTGVAREATPTIVGSEVTALNWASYWGLRADLTAYFDATGAAVGEAAFLHVTEAGTFLLIRPE